MLDIGEIIIIGIAALLAITFHEAAHGYAALRLGDDTAKRRGRETLNPLKHIDPIGTVALPALLIAAHSPFVFGYAKPVPVKWSALRNPKRGMSLVAAAGPLTNIALGIIFSVAGQAYSSLLQDAQGAATIFRVIAATNFVLGFFNLLPIPPLDGSKVLAGFLSDTFAKPYLRLGRYGVITLIAAIVGFAALAGLATSAIRSIF